MIQKNKFLQDPLKEKGLPLFAKKLGINHYSPTQFSIPDSAWLYKYCVLTQEQRRSMFKSNSAMEAGKKTGEALIRTFADTVYKISPTTKKVAPTTNEKISLDNAIQEQLEYFKEYEPADDKDADKKFKYLEEVPEVTRAAHTALTELGVASHVTCERQISIPTDNVEVSFRSLYPFLPIVGRIDFDFNTSSEVFGTPVVPQKIIELKTKWSKLGKIKKDGSRSFISIVPPSTPSFNHLVQVAVYCSVYDFKVPGYLVYATPKGHQIFDSTNCIHLTQQGMERNLAILCRTFLRREKILAQFQDLTKNEIIENAVEMIDPNFDHPYAFNDFPPEMLQHAKELWKVA